MTRTIDLQAIRERAAAATPGPWFWRGDRSTQEISLDAKHPKWGVCEVMTFRRWGMQHAKPIFTDFDACLLIPETEDHLIYQVCPEATSHRDPRVYRQTIAGIRHPDAVFIAAARQGVDDLLAHIDALEKRIHAQQPLVEYALNAQKMNGPFTPAGVGAHRAYREYQERLEEAGAA